MEIKTLHTTISKLGKTRRGPHSRIWIEGHYLAAAGFLPGQYYLPVWKASKTAPLTLELLRPDDIISGDAPRKVSGKGDKPIIDITNDDVSRVFGSEYDRVLITFQSGKITIRGSV